MLAVVEARTGEQMAQVRTLFLEYAASLPIDLGFQGFGREFHELPGRYAPPGGGLWLALLDEEPVGCVALRPLEPPRIAELKRLYVRPEARGHRAGLALTQCAIERAREAGYDSIRLDTLASMLDAQRLYRRLGFTEILPYTFNPIPGAVFMEFNLRASP